MCEINPLGDAGALNGVVVVFSEHTYASLQSCHTTGKTRLMIPFVCFNDDAM